jgi:hypothetical protein
LVKFPLTHSLLAHSQNVRVHLACSANLDLVCQLQLEQMRRGQPNFLHGRAIGELRQNFFPLARAEMRGEKEEKVESKTVLGLITKSLKS